MKHLYEAYGVYGVGLWHSSFRLGPGIALDFIKAATPNLFCWFTDSHGGLVDQAPAAQ